MTTISVVIPTRNRPDVLVRALEHLQSGSVMPDEVLVVDDGSKLPVDSILDSAKFSFSLRVMRIEPGRGAPAARNAGMRAATGDILLMIDDDIFVDYHAIRYHKLIHEQHPQPNYGIMGRVYFDPDLVRTPLMHFLEEYDCFQEIAKAPDKSRAISGLISANFSLKRSFIEGKELFDEGFPFNRNEDTEFGLRLMRDGLELRFHVAPSARHHSPLALETHFQQVWKGGFSKAYWSLKSPDDSKNCLQLAWAVNRKRFEEHFMEAFEAYVECFDSDFLKQDIESCSPTEFEAFGFFVKTATGWFQAIGCADGWNEMVPGFSEAASLISDGIDDDRSERRLDRFKEAYEKVSDFLPAAILVADELSSQKRLEEAADLLRPHASVVWVKLRLADIARLLGDFATCEKLMYEIVAATGHGRAVDWEQRNLLGDIVKKSGKKLISDQNWATDVLSKIDDLDVAFGGGWVDALTAAASPGAPIGMSRLKACEEKLKEVGRTAHYAPGQSDRGRKVYDFLKDNRGGAVSKVFNEIAALAEAFSARRSPARSGPQYR